MLWRLTIVVLPFILLLVIPGVIYREILMRLSRKMKQEFSKEESRAEQAISSVRTIYAFVGHESKASSAYSAALQLPAKLGLRQGLARGLVVGNNGVVFAVWSYYGSRMLKEGLFSLLEPVLPLMACELLHLFYFFELVSLLSS